jgi:hypothetical protein
MFQKHFDAFFIAKFCVLRRCLQIKSQDLPSEASNVQWYRAHTTINVSVSGHDPFDHLQIIYAYALLEEIVSLLVVHSQNIFTLKEL